MLSTEREEFEKHLAVFFAGVQMHDTPEARQAYWIGLAKMALADVVRVIEQHLTEERETKPTKLAPGQFWRIAREIKAKRREAERARPAAPLELTEHASTKFDRWGLFANRHLWNHVHRRGQLGHYYASDAVRQGHRSASSPDQETTDIVAVLLAHKNLWAQEMREAADEERIPADGGQAWWQDRLRRAEEQITEIRAAYAQQMQREVA